MAEKLGRLNIVTPLDLLFHYPRTYINYQNPAPIRSLRIGDQAVIRGKIRDMSTKRTARKWMSIIEFIVGDESGELKVIYFNQPYLKNVFKEGEEYNFSGKVGFDFQANLKSLASPQYSQKPEILPIYPETRGVTSKYLQKLNTLCLAESSKIEEFLPAEVIKSSGLLSQAEALVKIHQPKSLLESDKAKRRLAFEELYLTSLRAQLFRKELKKNQAPVVNIKDADLVKFVDSLKFKLTIAQKKSAWQIINDLKKNEPMNRLLNGDVGSGKTVVAAMAIYSAVKAGYKAIILAPTDILANQHFETLKELLEPFKITVDLVTANRKERSKGAELTVGTHALFFDKKPIENMALVVIDEQHRFGVSQREALLNSYKFTCLPAGMANNGTNIQNYESGRSGKNTIRPHLLSMTATPIPRTLQLTLYGDLDVSIIDELPAGRKKTLTKVYADSNRQKAYDLIRQEIKSGHQVFVICPLIEEAEPGENLLELDKKSVISEFEKLKKRVFPEFNIGLMHGRLKVKEKTAVMDQFIKGEIDLLVSTSVVEVGVDIPKATVMMVEDAERFGLATLHQFRGRVGRNNLVAHCLLMTRSLVPDALTRLKALENIDSGFQLAEMDLKFRGPGQVYGALQSGFNNLRLDWISDIFILEEAREAAKKTLERRPDLSDLPLLKAKLDERFESVHLE